MGFNIKRFKETTLMKDYSVACIAGLMSGFAVLLYSIVFPALKEGNFRAAGVWFFGYVIAAAIFPLFGYWLLRRFFVKKTGD